ncbi:hypothetical protein GWI33_020186 [Rhynchophorus ferrugineus]|uniref:Uncharacterized protein n=1 Tax=Rhynchophorus ferrugineus TaxID=354439 RepID=A0A834M4H2_RHYFE|nr:hypothetical protein GWI33_020186 [Rhynchophorus ferrugineus]
MLRETNICIFPTVTRSRRRDVFKIHTNLLFPDKERIMMWAQCYRTTADINTNMAIESANKYIKYNKLKFEY